MAGFTIVVMPKASIHKYGFLTARKHYIWFTWKAFGV